VASRTDAVEIARIGVEEKACRKRHRSTTKHDDRQWHRSWHGRLRHGRMGASRSF